MFTTAVVQPIVAYGQEQDTFSSSDEGLPYDPAHLFSSVVESAGMDPNADWTESFGTTDEEDVGKYLYYKVWHKVQIQPIQDATRNISGNYGMTQSELVMVLQNDYSTILERKPNITQEEAQEKVAEIQQKFKEEKELLTLQASIRSSVESSEMFANDDLSDSGFDLINDLRIIEELLFLHTEPIEVGGTWFPDFGGDGGGGGGGAGAEEEAGPEAGAEAGVPGAEGGAEIPAGAGAGATATGTAPGTAGTGAGTAPGTGVAGADTGAINPNSCFDDNQYSDAFADFEDSTSTDPNLIDRGGATGPVAGVPSTTGVPGTGTGGGIAIPTGDGTPSTGTPSAAGEDFFPDLTEGQPVTHVEAAEAGDWTKELPCNDIYCLTINFVMEPMRSRYQDPDNCIACHVEKINDVLQDVVGHSLTPSKAPGNLGESAECKKAMVNAFGNVNINFYAVAMPVRTPLNDDIIWGTSLEEEWYNFCSQTAFYPFDECPEPGDTEKPISQFETKPSFTDNYSQRVITMSADGADQTTLIEGIETATKMKTEEVSKAGAAVSLEETNDNSLVTLDPLLTEMDQMNYYFENFKDILQSLHTPVEDLPGPQACTSLKNKKECE